MASEIPIMKSANWRNYCYLGGVLLAFLSPATVAAWIGSVSLPISTASRISLFAMSPDLSTEEALARTKAHLEKLKQRQSPATNMGDLHPQQQQSITQETFYRKYISQSANSLKHELKQRNLPTKGRKPDLARRLAAHDLASLEETGPGDETIPEVPLRNHGSAEGIEMTKFQQPVSFAGLPLSETAAGALHQAGFLSRPSPIQAVAIPAQINGESVLLHAPTGSGKTLAYLLPITEYLWAEPSDMDIQNFAVVVTPTRELAAQVAGVASSLAPPGSVRLISHPSNLMTDGSKERSDRSSLGKPKIIVGSAKAIVHSLYGNDQYPAPPTPKPLALQFLKSTRVLVMDEVDRLLAVEGKYTEKKKQHDKPAAILAAAVARHTLGRAQVVAASATVGRPLKRELARVLGLPPPKGPRVIVAEETIGVEEKQQEDTNVKRRSDSGTVPVSARAVTIPSGVRHSITAVAPKNDEENSASSGQLLTSAYQVVQDVIASNSKARILLVLTKGFGISTQHVIGALQHFNCQPEPQSLLDALQENVQGTDHMVEVHRQVSGATGVGQALGNSEETCSLWVTGEDTIRGLHLDGLDVVIVVGRPRGPDEYTHIAGRTGRAGRTGHVIAIVAENEAPLITAWETMLRIKWEQYEKD